MIEPNPEMYVARKSTIQDVVKRAKKYASGGFTTKGERTETNTRIRAALKRIDERIVEINMEAETLAKWRAEMVAGNHC